MLDYFYKVRVNKPNIIIFFFFKAKYKNLIKVLIRLNLIYTRAYKFPGIIFSIIFMLIIQYACG